MKRLRWRAPVVVAAILLVATAVPVAAAPAMDGHGPAWTKDLLSWLLDRGLPDLFTADASSPAEPEDPTLADRTDDPHAPTSPLPDDGNETEGAPYIDPNG